MKNNQFIQNYNILVNMSTMVYRHFIRLLIHILFKIKQNSKIEYINNEAVRY